MESLLYELYSGEYDFTPKRDKKQQELYEALSTDWDKVQRMFGDEFADRIFDIEGDLEERRSFQYYQEGFRLGVRLMLEALTPA